MNRNDPQFAEEKAWLQLMHTSGIGAKTAWKVYHKIRESGLGMAEALTLDETERANPLDESPALKRKLNSLNLVKAEERFDSLLKSTLRLCHPGSSVFSVPEIPDLPPTLTLWGHPELLSSRKNKVLMKSRNTPEATLKLFLMRLKLGQIARQNWCFCPFSRLDWELVESLLKLDCGVILGLVSGIFSRAQRLASEIPSGRVLLLAPEPPLRSRWAVFACVEAFYRLFCSLSGQILVLHARERGKTERRLNWARERGCRITEFDPALQAPGEEEDGAILTEPTEMTNDAPTKPSEPDDDDRFISCL